MQAYLNLALARHASIAESDVRGRRCLLSLPALAAAAECVVVSCGAGAQTRRYYGAAAKSLLEEGALQEPPYTVDDLILVLRLFGVQG